VPELPEVETTRRGLAALVEGERIDKVIVRNPNLRWPVDLPDGIAGQTIERISRRAKYLIFELQRGCLIVHLGMSGNLRVVPVGAAYRKHDHVAWRLASGSELRLHDPRRFGSVHWHSAEPLTHWLLANLGVEPLANEFNGAYLKAQAAKRRAPVKNFIMDAHVVVGVGNIYANEALFLAGIRPSLRVNRLPLIAWDRLAHAIREVLLEAIRLGGTTLRDFVKQDGNPGYFTQSLNVYGRQGEPCRRCATPLTGCRIGQRATTYCRSCQRTRGFGA